MTLSNKTLQFKIMNKIRNHMRIIKVGIEGKNSVCEKLDINVKTFYNWLHGDTRANAALLSNLYIKYIKTYNNGKDL